MLKNLNDTIDKLNHIFEGSGINENTDFNNIENGVHTLLVTHKTVLKGHNFPMLDNSKDNPDVTTYGVLLQIGLRGQYETISQIYFAVGDNAAIYLRLKAGGTWSNWVVNR